MTGCSIISMPFVALFQMETVVDSPISSGSTGQQKKVALSAALLTDTPILLLDEPLSGGLDASGILALRKVLQRLVANRQATVVMTSPVPELVEQLATRVVRAAPPARSSRMEAWKNSKRKGEQPLAG